MPGDVAACAAPYRAMRVPWLITPPPSRAARLGATRARRPSPIGDATSWLPPAPASASAAERYAVGRWDGNTLVVESTGHDERTWIDHFGYPHSDEMVLEERYTRINYDTIELKMTLTDRKYYTKPWTSETKRMHLLPAGTGKPAEPGEKR